MTNPYDAIREHLMRAVPFATFAGVIIDTVGPGTARATLPFRPEVTNHIATPHAGAMFTLGEAASGAAMAGAFADILLTLRPVAAEAKIGFLKIARGTLTAEAQVSQPANILRATLESAGKVVFDVTVTITDETGAQVGAMSVAWHVSRARA